jgi:hypothetical protein
MRTHHPFWEPDVAAFFQDELADFNERAPTGACAAQVSLKWWPRIVPLCAAHAATMDATAVAHTAARISDFGWI